MKPRRLMFRMHSSLAGVGVLLGGFHAQGGDILRGGAASARGNPRAGTGVDSPTPAASEAAYANARDQLARTTQALDAVRSMQAAARTAATQSPNSPGVVPDGLVTHGLKISAAAATDPTQWSGAKLPSQTVQDGITRVSIEQTAQQALLHWETFNVGKNTSLRFDQSKGGANASQWIAFNKVSDPAANPSQILGNIQADGQIYLINPNGVIFGSSSQVNARSLTVSTLPINENLIAAGLLNNPESEFLFNGLGAGKTGDLRVEAGAKITSTVGADGNGGRVMLVGANVINAGTISTPNGQTILAAGLQVGVAAHASNDPSLRGLDAFVGAIQDPTSTEDAYAGNASNSGIIQAERGNITIAAKNIRQDGVMLATTSVDRNGRIDLLANCNAVANPSYDPLNYPDTSPYLFQSTGIVTLGAGSETVILPELWDASRIVSSQWTNASRSRIDMQGLAVHLESNATIFAPNADVRAMAGAWNDVVRGGRPQSDFLHSTGQIHLDSGAAINVAGSVGVLAAVIDRIIQVKLLGSELADVPVQRNGVLRGATVTVDTGQNGVFDGKSWLGTPVADVSGSVALLEKSVGQLTAAGGTVTLGAGDAVVLQAGSRIDVSGGSIDYQGGMVETTRLLSGGHWIDISRATPDQIYSGIYSGFTKTHSRWNLTETFVSPLMTGKRYEAGYREGAAAGGIHISAAAMVLDGTLAGNATMEPRQRALSPTAGSLSLAFEKQDAATDFKTSPTPPRIVFRTDATLAAADAFSLDATGIPLALREDRVKDVILSPDLLEKHGFGSLSVVNSDGEISLPADVALSTPASGAIAFSAANLDISGNITSPGGRIDLTVHDYSPYALLTLKTTSGAQTPRPDPTRGNFTLGVGASLSTAGLVVDDRLGMTAANSLPLVIRGGSITIQSHDMDLRAGSVIDVSGGVAIHPDGGISYGNGGSLTLQAGRDPSIGSLLGGHLDLGATLMGFAGLDATAGKLSLLAPSIQIGGASAQTDTLLLEPGFFSTGGFGTFQLTGLGLAGSPGTSAVTIAAGTRIRPEAAGWLARPHNDGVVLIFTLLPEGLRTPVNLTFNAPGVIDDFSNLPLLRGDVVMESGASIQTDFNGNLTLAGNTVAVLGEITAPGGSITITGSADSTLWFADQEHALPTVHLGPESKLSTAGGTLLLPDADGYRSGSVLAGGTISVSGNLVAESGALLDVSGASGVLDLPPTFSHASPGANGSLSGLLRIPTRIDRDAGTISLMGKQSLFTDATLRGAAGGSDAQGGNLVISSGRFVPPNSGAAQTPLDVTLRISQSGPTLPASFSSHGQSAIGRLVTDADGSTPAGLGYFSADQFLTSGMESLTLAGVTEFSGAVTLHATRSLTVATGGILYGDSAIQLSAPYLAIGTTFQAPQEPGQIQSPFQFQNAPFQVPPVHGSGNLTLSGSMIDLGHLSLQHIGQANFLAADGDIRGNGVLNVAGDITLTAGQIYPTTATSFTIAAHDYQSGGSSREGTVTIRASGDRKLPLSAGGKLNLYASVIHQGGVLRAPFGSIQLGWDGTGTGPVDLISGKTFAATRLLTLSADSVTSVSAVDPQTGIGITIPYGINLGGTSWIDPAGTDITATGLPEKSIRLSAMEIEDQAGSTIDIRGGGDLYAYRFVKGTGGSTDLLDSTSSFAILPGFEGDFAPYAPFNPGALNPSNLNADPGYTNSTLHPGDRIWLAAGNGWSAGYFTLLPARYALLPGAFLVTPKTTAPTTAPTATAIVLNDGASLVPGFCVRASNASTASPGTHSLYAFYEVAPSSVVRSRAEYEDTSANRFFETSTTTRRPADSGHLVLEATRAMMLAGAVSGSAGLGGRGGMVDISSPVDILISGAGSSLFPREMVLDARNLSTFGAESLLIGGIRQSSATGTTVAVTTNHITLDQPGSPLSAPDLILAVNQSLTVASGSQIETSGQMGAPAETLLLGSDEITGSGDGVLLRVSRDGSARVVRSGVSASSLPTLTLGSGAHISGAGIVLDSTHATSLDPGCVLTGTAVSLASGQISLQLGNPGLLPSTPGLVLSGGTLQTLQSGARSLTLQSYTSIDLYGAGEVGLLDPNGKPVLENLSLQAGEIRGFQHGDGAVTISARNLTLGNGPNGRGGGSASAPGGILNFIADTISLDANSLAIDSFAAVSLHANKGIFALKPGSLTAEAALTLTTPLLTGATSANLTLASGADLIVRSPGGPAAQSPAAGLGAKLTLRGSSVSTATNIVLPSGNLTLHATGGDVVVGGRLDVAGLTRSFHDSETFSDGGQISITSDSGEVKMTAGCVIDVSAPTAGGDAGSVLVHAAGGSFAAEGPMRGTGGSGGTFSLDAGTLPGHGTAALDAILNAGGFFQSRTIRVRDGDVFVDGWAKSRSYNLSADRGAIFVTGNVDASGLLGGSIHLDAYRDIALAAGSSLSVAALDFDAAGKGGSISLETRGADGSVIDLQSGSSVDLSVAANSASSASNGKFTGTLHLRAPQTAGNDEVSINPLAGAISHASSIVVEGFNTYVPANGSIDSAMAAVRSNGIAFLGSPGTAAAGYSAMRNRLLGSQATALDAALNIQVGAEITNPTGDLTLAKNWDFSGDRFGPQATPGVLTLHAAGNLNFNFRASLSDGFDGSTSALWQAPMLVPGSQSWSYRLVAGADFTAADFRNVLPGTSLAANAGAVLVGKNSPALPVATNNSRQTILPNYYQTIRTGTGGIDIHAGRDVLLLNPLATIYTAGTQAPAMEDFDLPALDYRSNTLGSTQSPIYPAQYSFGGGSVTISAQNDIARAKIIGSGSPTPDSTREMPNNWLYRRGYVDPTTGEFAASVTGGGVASTSWWIDFSNFYQGVGALGGGHVTLTAGHDVSNVDAVIPTNARMPKGTPEAASLLELGGGDLVVRSGHDIDGGVYYIERGQGKLQAGNRIRTNATRAALSQLELSSLAVADQVPDPTTWLPTTLFLGKGGFDLRAGGDLLLGPVANAFLLPQGINNSFYNKTYFSTYDPTSFVNTASLTGSVTLKNHTGNGAGSLESWFQNVLLYYGNPNAFSRSQPWLRLAETSITPFQTALALMPGTLRATAFSGDIGVVGNLTLSPAPSGTVDLLAAGAIHGLQVNRLNADGDSFEWGYGTILLSDADPARIPSVAAPLSLPAPATGFQGGAWNFTAPDVLADLNALFDESGSILGSRGVLQTQQALHAPGLLHRNDTTPVHLVSGGGDISGLTLFSAKSARIIASGDIADVAFYLQNTGENDLSLISAGRDIIAYHPNSALRQAAQEPGNLLSQDGASVAPLAGDFQISGPGTLEVLAGRNLDLGVGANRPDGTAVGLTSIGNSRNPALPATGANIVAAAGVGGSNGLSAGNMDFPGFIDRFLNPVTGGAMAMRYLPELGVLMNQPDATAGEIWASFGRLPAEKRSLLALEVFYRILRDSGRDFNSATAPDDRNHDHGFDAIAALFPGKTWQGDISLTSRQIKTTNGGDIHLLAPGGKLTVGFDLSGNRPVDQGILTEAGGNISIFSHSDVIVGTSRIFTLRGGNEIIWSSTGDIAAGASAKTVQSAPPTRVLIDPQSADVKTDLAGLATGGGIGVLATVPGVTPGDVDLIAPTGTIDAGDAGIRVSGNLSVSAPTILNAANIQVSGASSGPPALAAPAPSLSPTSTAWTASSAATDLLASNPTTPLPSEPLQIAPASIYTVEVIGYGGEDDEEN